jgi:hypothetical protein
VDTVFDHAVFDMFDPTVFGAGTAGTVNGVAVYTAYFLVLIGLGIVVPCLYIADVLTLKAFVTVSGFGFAGAVATWGATAAACQCLASRRRNREQEAQRALQPQPLQLAPLMVPATFV